jgi:hypothetical protein
VAVPNCGGFVEFGPVLSKILLPSLSLQLFYKFDYCRYRMDIARLSNIGGAEV